jgi:hypothetical protein
MLAKLLWGETGYRPTLIITVKYKFNLKQLHVKFMLIALPAKALKRKPMICINNIT